VIAAPENGGWHVLYVGETNDLADGSWLPHLESARERQQSAECLVRLSVSHSVREDEVSDIATAS
jgi:hypothetical protein